MSTTIDRGCFERGCACYDTRIDKDGVRVVNVEQFLSESGHYLTNDASREAAIADAVSMGKQEVSKMATVLADAMRDRITALESENAQLREQNTNVDAACAKLEAEIEGWKADQKENMRIAVELQAELKAAQRRGYDTP